MVSFFETGFPQGDPFRSPDTSNETQVVIIGVMMVIYFIKFHFYKNEIKNSKE